MSRGKREARDNFITENWAAIIIAAVILAAGIIWTELEERAAEEARYIDSWQITENRNIEWTWAGRGL